MGYIHYSQKYIWMKVLRTISKRNLEYYGPYDLVLLQKAKPMPARGYNEVPIFYVETSDQKYKGMLEVNLLEYDKGKVGTCFQLGGVIINNKKNFYYMSKYDNAKLALRKAVNWARIRFVMVVIITLIFGYYLIQFLRPLIYALKISV